MKKAASVRVVLERIVMRFCAHFMWVPIKYAPHSGEILATNGSFIFITEYRPGDVDGSGFGSIHSCCGYYEDLNPARWMYIPYA